jgi:antitoxin (DNA-binding transcriptional repressor) of toxin-antitoxin stability system
MAKYFEIEIPNVEDFVEGLVAQAEAGEIVILTRNGEPVACITPAVYPNRGFGALTDPESEA